SYILSADATEDEIRSEYYWLDKNYVDQLLLLVDELSRSRGNIDSNEAISNAVSILGAYFPNTNFHKSLADTFKYYILCN
ncbi:MAG: hypothetical protein LUD68_02790, partial [Rikenellaceae bacterium]|nr:hypothetical protein [Rikenellaceae bacterium]